MSTDLPTSLVWTNPAAKEKQPTLVRLTHASLTLATVPAADLAKVADGLHAGEELAGQVIPLSSVTEAEADPDGTAVTVRYRTGPSKTESADVPFADKAQRDEFLLALVGGLGPAWQRRDRPVSRWGIGSALLIPTVLLALATWGMYVEAAHVADGNPPFNWGRGGKLKLFAGVVHWVEAVLGPTGVLVAGGILVGLGVVLFLAAMASPPLRIVVEPAPEGYST